MSYSVKVTRHHGDGPAVTHNEHPRAEWVSVDADNEVHVMLTSGVPVTYKSWDRLVVERNGNGEQ